jgi:hypothetical protein
VVRLVCIRLHRAIFIAHYNLLTSCCEVSMGLVFLINSHIGAFIVVVDVVLQVLGLLESAIFSQLGS